MIKGYKVFCEDWTCRDKQYACPGKFEEDVDVKVCGAGMHFCKRAIDCFNYYSFDPRNHVCEVVAFGEVAEEVDKCCTNGLEIVREIPWSELLGIVNVGFNNAGLGNSGDFNSGDYNSGDYNSGDRNSGHRNSGHRNSGHCNSGDFNSGNRNSGDYNSGIRNSGNYNSGDDNSGNYNSGDFNSGNFNSGDFNRSDRCTGVFCTQSQPFLMFNKPTNWTYEDWRRSKAFNLLYDHLPTFETIEWVYAASMSDDEKKAHPDYEVTDGYLKILNKKESNQLWWDSLDSADRDIIFSLPNFDQTIFEDILGIHIGKEGHKV